QKGLKHDLLHAIEIASFRITETIETVDNVEVRIARSAEYFYNVLVRERAMNEIAGNRRRHGCRSFPKTAAPLGDRFVAVQKSIEWSIHPGKRQARETAKQGETESILAQSVPA